MQFCADLRKKSKSIKAICIYASERSRYALLKNDIVYYAMSYCLGDVMAWSQRILLNICWFSIFPFLIANISWTVAQAPINHIIFWKSVMRTFRYRYVNCFNRLTFLAEVSSKLQKKHFLDNLRTIILEGNMEIKQMTPIFSSAFSALTVCNIHFCINQKSFSCGLPFGSFWSVTYLNLGQKLSIWTAHHPFLERRHHEVTKNPYYVLSPEKS